MNTFCIITRPEAIIPKILPIILFPYSPAPVLLFTQDQPLLPSQKIYAVHCRFLSTGRRWYFSLHSFARSDCIRAHSHARIEMLGGEV